MHRNLVIATGQVYGAKVSRPSHVIDDFREVTHAEGIISCFFIEGSVINTQSERVILFLCTGHIGAVYGEQNGLVTFCSSSLLISLFTSALQAVETRHDLIIGVSSTNGMRCVMVIERPLFPGPAKTPWYLFSNFNSLAFWSAVSYSDLGHWILTR